MNKIYIHKLAEKLYIYEREKRGYYIIPHRLCEQSTLCLFVSVLLRKK